MEGQVFTLGVVGSGVMGCGVAERFAVYGHRVILLDVNPAALLAAQSTIRRRLNVYRMMGGSVDVATILQRITYTDSYQDLKQADFIIESVVEKTDVKAAVFACIEEVSQEDCIYISNTSCIPITEIGSFAARPDRVIGVHFMNPASTKNFAEVIKGYYTSDFTVSRIKELLLSAGITCEVINDSPGFVTNRLSHLFMNEAANIVYEGVATPEQVDNIFKKGFGHSMGPLETADLIGLDTVVDSLRVLYDRYEDTKYKVCPLLKKMVTAGLKGQKSGEGFYQY